MFKKDLSHITWAEVKRRQLQRLSLVHDWIRLTAMTSGLTVVDIGPGPGLFTREYAKIVGKDGKVYAIEKSLQAIEFLKKELDGIANVEILNADAEQGISGAQKPDIVLVSDVLHHTDFPERILRGVYEKVDANAKILVSEFDPTGEGKIGPPVHNRIAEDILRAVATDIGFEIVSQGKQSHEHYYLLLKRRDI